MSVPGKHKSKSSTKRGRSHEALKKTKLNKCTNCGQSVPTHQACPNCGTYKGRDVRKKKVSSSKAGTKSKAIK